MTRSLEPDGYTSDEGEILRIEAFSTTNMWAFWNSGDKTRIVTASRDSIDVERPTGGVLKARVVRT